MLRKAGSLTLCLILGLMAHGAWAESVERKLDKARAEQEAAREAVAHAESRLGTLLDEYQGLTTDLEQAAIEVAAGYDLQDQLSFELAEAQQRLDDRVTAAYELGPGAAIGMFLGAQSTGDFASIQVYASSTFQVDDSSVTEVTGLKRALAEAIGTREGRQQDLAGSVARVEGLAAQAAEDLRDARSKAKAAGLEVKRLEKEVRELEEARAAAAAALAQYLGTGGVGAGCASGAVHDLIVEAFTPIGQVDTALAVATRESNCRPNAWNDTVVPPYGNAAGVFQILYPGIWEPWSERCGYEGADPFDPEANVAVAACVVADQGWWPWGV